MENSSWKNQLLNIKLDTMDRQLSVSKHFHYIVIDLVRTLSEHSEELKSLKTIYEFLKLLTTNEIILKEESEAFTFTCEVLIDKCFEIVQSKNVEPSVEHIIFDILHICIGYCTLKKCSLLLGKVEENLCYTNAQNSVIGTKILINLYFLETMLKALPEKLNLCAFDLSDEIHCKLNSKTLCNTLIDLVFLSNNVVKSVILLSIVPKLLCVTNTNFILKNIWNYISADSLKSIELKEQLFCLCSLTDFFLTFERKSSCLVHENEFWKIIQLGLSNIDPLLRKEALYLLKRAVDTLDQNTFTVNTELFSWKSTNNVKLKEIWELIFIILEVLEEKQAHLVTPVIPSVLKIQDFCKTSCDLHPSWLLCIYSRVLKHDSVQVIKWGVIHFLKADVTLYEKSQFEPTIYIFLETINNMSLFVKVPDKLSELSEIETELNKWFLCISKCANYKLLFTTILNATSKIHWSSVPLFHFLNCFSSVIGVKVWDNSCLIVIKDFISEALSTQTLCIRGAIQCNLLKILISLSNSDAITIDIIMNTLNAFRHNESLYRGTEIWSAVVNWLKSFITKKDVEHFVQLQLAKENVEIHLSSESFARSLVLLFDAGLTFNRNETNIVFDLLTNHFECLDRAGVRLYSCVRTQDESLKLIKNILLELKLNENNTHGKIHDTNFYKVLQTPIMFVMSYLHRRLIGITEINDYFSVELYIDLLNCLSNSGFITKSVIEDIVALQSKAFEISTRPTDDKIPAIKHYFSIHILNWSAKYISCGKNVVSTSMVEIITTFVKYMTTNNRLNIILYKDKQDANLTRNFQVLWGRIASGSIQAAWSILNEYYNIVQPSHTVAFLMLIELGNDFVQQGLDALQIGGRNVIIYILDVFKIILPKLLDGSNEVDINLTMSLVASSWKACFELRKMDLFWPAFKKWIAMFFQKDIITGRHNSQYILHYSEEILSQGESITGLCYAFVSHLQKESIGIQGLHLLRSIFVSFLMFGTLQRRDQRIENDTIEFIESLGSRFSISELISDSSRPRSDSTVRLHALDIILKAVYKDQERGYRFLVAVINQLLDKEQEMTNKKQRYYGDSLHHRIKNRILQSLLILESVLAESTLDFAQKCIADLHEWTYISLKGESQQPSVRYQLEWLFVCTYIHNQNVRSNFWTKFNQASKERIGSLCSFISIVYHLAVLLQDNDFIDESVQHILPGCMGQNFNVQLYAQTVLEKLFRLSEVVSSKYKFLEKCIPVNLAQGNTARNAIKLKQDFYFAAFHPIKHFSLQTVYLELPRLSNLTHEEWISLPELNKTITEEYPSVPKYNLDSSLSTFQTASWVVKATEANENRIDALGVQKKFVPWKGMTSDSDTVSSEQNQTAKEGLVVVASLIDKIPNLGGLSRTCEIFAVSNLVLGSLEYVQNKEFSVLSMSAEKHIRITEVKLHNLAEYLSLMKKNGYTVVGAEQTAGSVALGAFQFPKKCLLLLGNEKEGIPVNLIHLLDKCVEIPQYGVVRSLNVHVTGALFVWEYTRQHQQ